MVYGMPFLIVSFPKLTFRVCNMKRDFQLDCHTCPCIVGNSLLLKINNEYPTSSLLVLMAADLILLGLQRIPVLSIQNLDALTNKYRTIY